MNKPTSVTFAAAAVVLLASAPATAGENTTQIGFAAPQATSLGPDSQPATAALGLPELHSGPVTSGSSISSQFISLSDVRADALSSTEMSSTRGALVQWVMRESYLSNLDDLSPLNEGLSMFAAYVSYTAD